MEKGVNTRELVKEHYELKEMYEELRTTSKKRIELLDSQVEKLTIDLEAAMAELTKQQEKVVMPLIAECSKREAQCQIMFKEVVERNKNLKILWAMVRSPKLCDLVYKTERKRFTAEKQKEV